MLDPQLPSLKRSLSSCSFPSFLDMMRLVSFSGIEDLEISIAIIGLDFVLMMDYFSWI